MGYWNPDLPIRGVPLALGDALTQAALLLIVMVAGVLAIAIQFLKVRELSGGRDEESPPPTEQTNCPSCGARIPTAAETCTYCGESVK